MDDIALMMDELAPEEELNSTHLPGVHIHRASYSFERTPMCYRQGIYIIGNGTKQVHLGGQVYRYDSLNYLVLTVPLPAECDGIGTPENPLLGMMVDIDLGTLNEVITEMEAEHELFDLQSRPDALFVSKSTLQMRETVHRLLLSLRSASEARIIGPGIIRELIYRIMCTENAASLYALATKNSNLARIDRALKQLHTNYHETIDVDALAALVHMSPSSFHRIFKEVTSTSPIQYLKRIRLDRARDLLRYNGLRVNEAAQQVGYESTPQFSREFKRIFGISPIEATS
ncbi:MAG: AraC family transcriptional regulator N-terminal domain-containing protein [Opitutales bacterium]